MSPIGHIAYPANIFVSLSKFLNIKKNFKNTQNFHIFHFYVDLWILVWVPVMRGVTVYQVSQTVAVLEKSF